jgi:hypothetical protein
MTVTYEGQKVFERSFTFNGPKTSAAGISYSTYDSYLPNPSGSGNMSYIAAPGINITLRNTGDLPFYIKNINARISSTSSSTSYSMTVAPHQGWVLPQKSATATAMTSYAFQSGTYSVSVWLTDASGTQMSPGMFSIPIPSK